jgi:hypothetical protein
MKLKESILRSIIKKQIKNLLFEQQQNSVFSGDTWSFWNGNKQIDGLTFEELTKQLQDTLKTKDKSRLLVWNENFEDNGLPDAWIEVSNIPATALIVNGDNSLQKINSIINPSEEKPQATSEPEATVSPSEETKEEPGQQEEQQQEEESGGPLGNEFYNLILKLQSVLQSDLSNSSIEFIKNNLDNIFKGQTATLPSKFGESDYSNKNLNKLFELICNILTKMFTTSKIYTKNNLEKAKDFSEIRNKLDNLYSICSELINFFNTNERQFQNYNVILPTSNKRLNSDYATIIPSNFSNTIKNIPKEYENFIFNIKSVGYKKATTPINQSTFDYYR